MAAFALTVMRTYGAYERFRFLVTTSAERLGRPLDELLRTRRTYDEAMALMRANGT